MPTWLLGLWERLQTSFWLVPSVMACSAVAFSYGLLKIDAAYTPLVLGRFEPLFEFGPEGARAVLSAIAGSMITVAGLTFSVTMLTLQLASSQFGPRMLRSFMRDRGNQIVLGTFTSTFLYCLLVLRAVRGTEGSSFVPHLSVAFGVVLATFSLAVLIYFIHHVATSIRIETLLGQLGVETRAAIDRLYPDQIGHAPSADRAPAAAVLGVDFESTARPIFAKESGYVQRVDEGPLLAMATKHDLLLRVDSHPGRFVTERDPLLWVAPLGRASDKAVAALRGAFVIGQDRTPTQDLEFCLRRFVEIAQRSLSTGINDPTTAMYCIDRLSEALRRLAERETPSRVRSDSQGRVRVITSVSTFEDLACPAIAAIARYGIVDADVVRKLQEMIEDLNRAAGSDVGSRVAALGASIATETRARLSTFDRYDDSNAGGII